MLIIKSCDKSMAILSDVQNERLNLTPEENSPSQQ